MAKVIMVSRDFMSPHPRIGQSTFFVEKIFKGLYSLNPGYDPSKGMNLDVDFSWQKFNSCKPKWHTIRGGKRWKDGDMASLRVWSGKPYRSPQIRICDDLRIEKVFDIEIRTHVEPHRTIMKIMVGDKYSEIIVSGGLIVECFGIIDSVCETDGLEMLDFFHWFEGNDFSGQIICWNENIDY